MAKRRRLSPARGLEITADFSTPSAEDSKLETKAVNGWVGTRTSRAPIADVASEAAMQSAFEEVAGELRSARLEGRMVLRLPLDVVNPTYLVRDRVAVDDEEMATLIDSLRVRGQQTPIEVVALSEGQYGLISGWRRLMALQALQEESPADDRFGAVLALVRVPESAAEAYRAMVEENEVRADLSFYERARIAVKSVEQEVYDDTKQAVQGLFSSARRAKRSKILSFTYLVERLDSDLQFPNTIPEKLGLALVQALRQERGFYRRLADVLRRGAPYDNPAAERSALEKVLQGKIANKVSEPEVIAKLRSDLTLRGSAGRVTLSGAAVDDALIAALREWLAQGGD